MSQVIHIVQTKSIANHLIGRRLIPLEVIAMLMHDDTRNASRTFWSLRTVSVPCAGGIHHHVHCGSLIITDHHRIFVDDAVVAHIHTDIWSFRNRLLAVCQFYKCIYIRRLQF